MNRSIDDFEFFNTDAAGEEVKSYMRRAEKLLEQPLPVTHALPKIALFGFQDMATGKNRLLKEIRVYESTALFSEDSAVEGQIRLFALPVKRDREENSSSLNRSPDIHRAVFTVKEEEAQRRLFEWKKEEKR